MRKLFCGNSLVIHWLGLYASTARDMGLTSGWGTQTPYAAQTVKKKKNRKKVTL